MKIPNRPTIRLKRALNIVRDANGSGQLQQTAIALGCSIFATVAGFLVQWLSARVLSPTDFGIYSIGLSLIGIGTIFALCGADTSMLQFSSRYRADQASTASNTLFLTLLKWCTGTSIVTIIVVYITGTTSMQMASGITLLVGACIGTITMTLLLQCRLRGIGAMIYSLLPESVVRPGLSLATLTLTYAIGTSLGASDLFLIILISSSVALMLSAYWTTQHNKTTQSSKQKIETDLKIEKKSWIRNNITFLSISIGNALNTQVGVLIFGWMSLTVEAGIFGIIVRLSTLTVFVTAVINTVYSPKFVELHTKQEFKLLKASTLEAITLSSLYAVPVFILLIGFPELVLSFFGAHFSAGAGTLQLAATGYLIQALSSPLFTCLVLTGSQKIMAKFQYASILINIVATVLLAPLFGMESAAIGTILSQILIACVVTFLAAHRIRNKGALPEQPQKPPASPH